MSLSYLQDNMGMILERVDGRRTLEHKLLHIHTRNVCCSCTFVGYELLEVLAAGAFPLPPKKVEVQASKHVAGTLRSRLPNLSHLPLKLK